MRRQLSPAVRPDRVPSRLDAREAAETCHELPIRHRLGRLAGDVANVSVAAVTLGDVPGQAFVDCPGTQDQQVVAPGHSVRDVVDKSIQVFDAMRLAGGLRAAATTVTDGGVVSHAPRGPVMSRDVRFDSFQSSPASCHPDDDGLPRVDPDERAGAIDLRLRGHDRFFHAGPASAFSARSA